MTKAKWIQAVFLILSLVWMGVIFGFSAQNGESSSHTSGKVVDQVAPIVIPDYEKLPEPQKIEKKESLTYYVRKTAHVTEYALLGLLLSFSMPFDRVRRLYTSLIALAICVLYAAADEIHQIFSGGRTPAVRDVLIDSLGALLGILCACLVLWMIERWKKRSKKKVRAPA